MSRLLNILQRLILHLNHLLIYVKYLDTMNYIWNCTRWWWVVTPLGHIAHWSGGYMKHRAFLDVVAKRQNLAPPPPGIEPCFSSPFPAIRRRSRGNEKRRDESTCLQRTTGVDQAHIILYTVFTYVYFSVVLEIRIVRIRVSVFWCRGGRGR